MSNDSGDISDAPDALAIHCLKALEQHTFQPPAISTLCAYTELVSIVWDMISCSDDEANSKLNPLLARIYGMEENDFLVLQRGKFVPDWSSLRNSLLRSCLSKDSKNSRQDQQGQLAHQLSQAGFPLSKSNSLAHSSGVSRVPSGTSLASLASIHEDDSHDFEVGPIWGTEQALSTNARVSRSQSLTAKSTSSSAKEKRRLECPYCCKVYSVGGHFQNHLRDHRELRPWQQVLLEPPVQQELFQVPSRNVSRNISQTSLTSMGQDFTLYPHEPGSNIFEKKPPLFHDTDMQMQLVDDVDEPPFFLTPTMRDNALRPPAFYEQSYDG